MDLRFSFITFWKSDSVVFYLSESLTPQCVIHRRVRLRSMLITAVCWIPSLQNIYRCGELPPAEFVKVPRISTKSKSKAKYFSLVLLIRKISNYIIFFALWFLFQLYRRLIKKLKHFVYVSYEVKT